MISLYFNSIRRVFFDALKVKCDLKKSPNFFASIFHPIKDSGCDRDEMTAMQYLKLQTF